MVVKQSFKVVAGILVLAGGAYALYRADLTVSIIKTVGDALSTIIGFVTLKGAPPPKPYVRPALEIPQRAAPYVRPVSPATFAPTAHPEEPLTPAVIVRGSSLGSVPLASYGPNVSRTAGTAIIGGVKVWTGGPYAGQPVASTPANAGDLTPYLENPNLPGPMVSSSGVGATPMRLN